VGERHPVVVPGPAVPVAAAKARGVHLDDHAPGDGAGSATDRTSTEPPKSSKTTARMEPSSRV
jgi:hypothetical protein